MNIEEKLIILADAAKYDVSCASSGSKRKNSNKRLGNAAACGICHTYTQDGRCVSLLKILLTNHCIYDCAYCVNRHSNDIPRAAFTPEEVVSLTIDFYRRNYIEGLFLSSGIMGSPDTTMERLVRVVAKLREKDFNGYIHLKCVPDASQRLIRRAGLHADRLSVNIELPSERSLRRLAREKTYASVLTPMGVIQETIAQTREDRKRMRHTPAFAPAGQSTQLIIGASPESDFEILSLANRLYRRQALKRVYYSAYIPAVTPAHGIPDIHEPPLRRENRLYQTDWLIRLYGFSLEELITAQSPFLDLTMDPKQAYALSHPEAFPVDLNTADREMILRVPGIGITSTNRILGLRRRGRIRFEHLKQMGVVLSRASGHIRCDGMPTPQWVNTVAPDMVGRRPEQRDRFHNEGPRVLLYDGTFDGLLTIVYRTYQDRCMPEAITQAQQAQLGLFERHTTIVSNVAVAERVWRGLKKRLGWKPRQKLYHAFLSGAPDVEMAICRYIHDIVPAASENRAHLTSHIRVQSLAKKVRKEAHRMKGFVRFERMAQACYLALVSPRYDVLPLIRTHFENRFADQHWIIYDTARNYGLVYDGHSARALKLERDQLPSASREDNASDQQHQSLWRQYYRTINIDLRNNPRLHKQNLPRRYWRYLTEKK